MSKHQRKTVQGSQFADVESLLYWIDAGNYTYLRGKPLHPLWVRSWRLADIIGAVRSGVLRRCLDRNGDPYSTGKTNLLFMDWI